MIPKLTPRVQDIVLPLLREGLGPGVHVRTWSDNVEHREYPEVRVRRLGGLNTLGSIQNGLEHPGGEITATTREGLAATEDLAIRCRNILVNSRNVVVPGVGHLVRVRETLGMTQFPSEIQGTWRVQQLLRTDFRYPRRRG